MDLLANARLEGLQAHLSLPPAHKAVSTLCRATLAAWLRTVYGCALHMATFAYAASAHVVGIVAAVLGSSTVSTVWLCKSLQGGLATCLCSEAGAKQKPLQQQQLVRIAVYTSAQLCCFTAQLQQR
jgi:hypothetical protein